MTTKKNFKETLADLFKLDELEPEKALEMTDRIAKLVIQRTLVRVLPTLSEEDMDEYEKIIEENDDLQVAFNFLNEKEPEFWNIMMDEAEILREKIGGDFEASDL